LSPRVDVSGAHGYRFVRGDIRDLAFLVHALQTARSERIIHLAGMLGEACASWPLEALEINVQGTMNVFEAARLTNVKRVVFASTRTVLPDFAGTVHGYPTHVSVGEDFPPSPRRPYEVMKYANEQFGRFYRERHGLETTALRFAMMFSVERARLLARGGAADASGFARRSAGPLHQMIWAAAFGERAAVSGGDRLLDLAYVKDIAHGIALACMHDGTTSPLYHLGSGRLCSVAEIGETLQSLSPGAQIRVSPGTEFGVGHFCLLNIQRAADELGYVPRFTLVSGLQDCLEELRAGARDASRVSLAGSQL
jgi:nucleoside-diphosphate-sugar epimerase